jgi:hypothetical protein
MPESKSGALPLGDAPTRATAGLEKQARNMLRAALYQINPLGQSPCKWRGNALWSVCGAARQGVERTITYTSEKRGNLPITVQNGLTHPRHSIIRAKYSD